MPLHEVANWCSDLLVTYGATPVPRVTESDLARGMRPLKSHCHLGHPYTQGNTVWDRNGYRHCLICKRRVNRLSMARTRARARAMRGRETQTKDVA